MSAIRRLPAIVLLVALGLLPIQAWLRTARPDVRYSVPLEGLRGITWAATVSPAGNLAVSIVYDLGDDQVRDSSIRLPSGARLVRADGMPVAADVGRYGEVQSQDMLTVTYERVGAVTRYSDGVIVDFAGIENSDQSLFPCARCHLGVEEYGNTSLAGALFADDLTDARFAIGGLDQLHADDDSGALRFVGVLPGADDATMIAWLPLAAAPDAPKVSGVPDAIRGETAAAVWAATTDADRTLEEQRAVAAPVGRVALATVLSAMWLVLVAWIVARIVFARRVFAADRIDTPIDRDAEFSPPSALEPALVAVLVGDTGRGGRSAVASTLLSLAHRGVIRIEGVDSTRYTLTVPPGARGDQFDEVVLAELRPQGKVNSTATLTGPPLWGERSALVQRHLAGLAKRAARKEGFVRVTLTAWVLVPATVVIGMVALIGSNGASWLAWLMVFVGPLVAVAAAVITGTSLTANGRVQRDRWIAYGAWLRTDTALRDVGAPGIATWGEPLVYAAALGAAPTAADALGTH